ncbi:hypothetical protein JAMAL_49 [Mycobacterium phage JAMaL]|uniref:CDGP domain-containing protein n=1 Tax=Mycobacterium phage JAMaL TaxID=1429905 RepID=V5UNL1_9CAUD|nr:hypothetical protein CH22_gp49 [Mycobacterium phage JAMaL]AHB79369.1 hypothetical protein JAMAL_49 [Mycobacterium phage JAMaL]
MMRRRAASAVAGAVVALGALAAPAQAAPPGFTCITTQGLWWGKGNSRDICDSARRPDGSWTRLREFYTPAHTIAASSYCSGGRYYSSCTYTPARFVPFASNGVERYEVSDAPGAVNQPLWDEPGWIAP